MKKFKEADEEATEAKSYPELILTSVLQSYESEFNRLNDKYDTKFNLTLTTHKVAMPEGNKDVVYLRLERGIRPKGSEEEWPMRLIGQELYAFRDLKERVNPDSPWKEQLFVNALGRFLALGLEYSELLIRTREDRKKTQKEAEERKLNLIITDKMPTEFSQDEKNYKEWLGEERKKEGLDPTTNKPLAPSE